MPLGEERCQLLLRAPAADPGRGLALLGRCPARVDGSEVELGDPRTQTRDLVRELLGPLGRGRLQRERTQPLAHLGLDVAGALDLDSDPVQLQLGAMLPPLELAETGRLLDQLAPLLRLRGQHRLDLALADDRVHRAAEPDVGEQLDEIGAAHLRLLTRYWPSPPRCSRRAIETSEKSSSPKPPLSLSKTSSTSQLSAGVRPSAPLKRTSSGFSARSSDGVSEPAAQTIASATFDLPEPFGPTTTATPGSSFSSSESGNDLKPRRRRERRCTGGRLAGAADGDRPALGLFGHAEHVLAAQLPDQLGCASPTCARPSDELVASRGTASRLAGRSHRASAGQSGSGATRAHAVASSAIPSTSSRLSFPTSSGCASPTWRSTF